MLLKLGVDISKLEYHCRRALNIVEQVFKDFCEELSLKVMEAVISSTYEGNHSPSSLHYQGRAFDIRLPSETHPLMNKEADKAFLDILKGLLGKEFDVILEGDHIHIEYDPK